MSKIIGRFVASILALLLASGVLHAQGKSAALSEEDEAKILESLVELQKKYLSPDSELGTIRIFSSANISSVSQRQIAKLGLSVITELDIQKSKIDNVIEYVVIRSIDLRNGIAVVKLSAVSEGRPCFGPAFYSVRSFSYAFQKNADQWEGRLLKRSLPFPFSKRVATMP
jgi:hypothetical protein